MKETIIGMKTTILFILIAIMIPTHSGADQNGNFQVALQEFEFDQSKTLSIGYEQLEAYFESDYYSQFDYDSAHPVIGSFIGSDCNQNPIKLVFVTYKSLNSDGMLWSVFRVSEDGKFALEGEGVGLAKNVSELAHAFKNPFDFGMCHTDYNE